VVSVGDGVISSTVLAEGDFLDNGAGPGEGKGSSHGSRITVRVTGIGGYSLDDSVDRMWS